jgi:hypothetical protein
VPFRRVLETDSALLAAADNQKRHGGAKPIGSLELVRDLEAFLTRYVILPTWAVLPLALWALMTFCFDSFDAVPYLVISSPTPRCGKTRLLECLELVVSVPRRASNVSEATLFRMIEKLAPTLLLD